MEIGFSGIFNMQVPATTQLSGGLTPFQVACEGRSFHLSCARGRDS